MLGALPAIGFLSTGVGVGVGHLAAYGAIAGFSATLTGPPNLSTGGSAPYDFQGSQIGFQGSYDFQGSHVPNYTGGYDFLGSHTPGTTGGYDFLGSHVPNSTGGNDFLGRVNSYNLSGHLNNAVWNLNASPWNDVFYGQIQGGYAPTEFPYNTVQYQNPAPYPPHCAHPIGSYDVSQGFANSYLYGSVASYQGQYPAVPSQPMPYGCCQPAYANPPSYVPAYQPTQTYALQYQQTGMGSFGAQQSSYQFTAPQTSAIDSWARVENGKVGYPALPPFESTVSWVGASQVVALRTVGSDANTAQYHFTGNDPRVNSDGLADERTTVWWALQQNDRLRFNADSGEFFVTYPDGSTRAVDTLANLVNVRQASGWDGQVAYKAFGDRIQEVMVTNDLITPPYQPGATALTTQQFGTQWDQIFSRPDNTALYGFTVPNQGPGRTLIPPGGVG